MLFRLIVVALAIGGVGMLISYLRAQKARGTLTAWDIADLSQKAQNSERLKAALAIRIGLLEAAPADRKDALARQADEALKQLAQQEELQVKIREALGKEDVLDLQNRIAGAQAALSDLSGDARRAKETHLETMESHLGQLQGLRARLTALEEHSDRLVLEMKNLHLALLEVSSTESTATGSKLDTSLERLAQASEEVRREAQAEAEIDRMLAAARDGQRNAS